VGQRAGMSLVRTVRREYAISSPEVIALLTRGWKWFFGRMRMTAYYPDEEPKTRGERSHETLGWSDHATWGEGSRSSDERRQPPR
jgi:hypothetical protein